TTDQPNIQIDVTNSFELDTNPNDIDKSNNINITDLEDQNNNNQNNNDKYYKQKAEEADKLAKPDDSNKEENLIMEDPIQ
ncbi:3315_t:CDS:1, partial [Racocetra persica]